MGNVNDPPDPANPVQKLVGGFLAFAAWLIGAIGVLFVPKPFYEPEAGSPLAQFSRYLATALITLTYVLTFVLATSAHKRGWLRSFVMTLVASIVLAGTFLCLRELWTISYYLDRRGAPTVIGSTTLDPAESKKPPIQLLDYHGGKDEEAWERTGLIGRRLILFGLYSFGFALFASALISGAQVVRLHQKSGT